MTRQHVSIDLETKANKPTNYCVSRATRPQDVGQTNQTADVRTL